MIAKIRFIIFITMTLTGACANMPPLMLDKTALQDVDFCLNLDGLEFEHQLIFIHHAKLAAKLATQSIKAITGKGSIDIVASGCRNFVYISDKPNVDYKGRAHRFTKTRFNQTRLSRVNIEITVQAYMSFFEDVGEEPFGLTVLLMHEFGHALGLDHVEDDFEDVMYVGYNSFQRLEYKQIKFMDIYVDYGIKK